MFKVSRVKRGPWMTMAALMAVVLASDPRLAHFSLCSKGGPSALATSVAGCEPRGEIDDAVVEPCGCCGPASPSHRGERDSRSVFVSSAPIREGVAPTSFSIPAPPFLAPATAASPFVDRRPAPVAASPLLLLCNHLLI